MNSADPGASSPDPFCEPAARSHLLMSAGDSALLVIDIQEKLIPLIGNHRQLVWNTQRLIDGAGVLKVPVRATEQYPKGLGHTVEPLRGLLAPVLSKTMFSCRECASITAELSGQVRNVVLAGIETHVCIQQSALDLMAQGYEVFVAVDAVGARHEVDHAVALRRMEQSGATLTTTEAVLMEWCEQAGTPAFKSISQIIRRERPEA